MDDHTMVADRPREGFGRRLGRGLNALLGGAEPGAEPPDVPERTIADRVPETATDAEIRVDAIDPNPFQPRREFAQDGLDELAGSIKQHGVLQSLLVRPCNGRFQLIAGERRLLAAKQAGLVKVPCRILELVDHEVAEAALEENIKRRDLNPLEKARAFKEYLDRFQSTIEELAKHLSMKRATVSNFLRLLELPESVKNALAADKISNGHARSLLSLDEQQQVALCERIQKENWSVRRTETEVRSILKPEAETADSTGDATESSPAAPAPVYGPFPEGVEPQSWTEPPAPAAQNDAEPAGNAHLESLADSLRDHFGTKVEIKQTGAETGRFVLHFGSNDEFERLLGMLRAA